MWTLDQVRTEDDLHRLVDWIEGESRRRLEQAARAAGIDNPNDDPEVLLANRRGFDQLSEQLLWWFRGFRAGVDLRQQVGLPSSVGGADSGPPTRDRHE